MDSMWKCIPEYEHYEVHQAGIVRLRESHEIVKPLIGYNQQGPSYVTITLSKKSQHKKTKPLQYWVGLAWVPNPEKYPHVVRKGKDALNNHYSNVVWSLSKRCWMTDDGKFCPVCEIFKPYTDFPREKSSNSGVSSTCKSCDNFKRRGTREFVIQDHPGYLEIPGFSRYAVNKDGIVRMIVNSKIMIPTKSPQRYCFNLTNDHGTSVDYSVKNLIGSLFLPKIKGLNHIYHSGRDIHNVSIKDLHWSLTPRNLITKIGRKCCSCLKFLPWSEFNTDKSKINEKDSTCRSCNQEKFNMTVSYSNYAHQLTQEEDPRPKDDGTLEVRCSFCKKYFTPSLLQVVNRIRSLQGRIDGESRLYDRDECKHNCVVHGMSVNYKNSKANSKTRYADARDMSWVKMVLDRDNHTCQKCGSRKGVQVHHIIPVAEDFMQSADISNGLTLCGLCHKVIHAKNNGCEYSELRDLCKNV